MHDASIERLSVTARRLRLEYGNLLAPPDPRPAGPVARALDAARDRLTAVAPAAAAR